MRKNLIGQKMVSHLSVCDETRVISLGSNNLSVSDVTHVFSLDINNLSLHVCESGEKSYKIWLYIY